MMLLLLILLFACALYALRKTHVQPSVPEDKSKGPRKPPEWCYVGGIIDNVHKTATAFFHDFANDDDRELEMSYVDSVSGDGLEMSARAVCNRWNMEEAEALRNTGSTEAGNPPGTK